MLTNGQPLIKVLKKWYYEQCKEAEIKMLETPWKKYFHLQLKEKSFEQDNWLTIHMWILSWLSIFQIKKSSYNPKTQKSIWNERMWLRQTFLSFISLDWIQVLIWSLYLCNFLISFFKSASNFSFWFALSVS